MLTALSAVAFDFLSAAMSSLLLVLTALSGIMFNFLLVIIFGIRFSYLY